MNGNNGVIFALFVNKPTAIISGNNMQKDLLEILHDVL